MHMVVAERHYPLMAFSKCVCACVLGQGSRRTHAHLSLSLPLLLPSTVAVSRSDKSNSVRAGRDGKDRNIPHALLCEHPHLTTPQDSLKVTPVPLFVHSIKILTGSLVKMELPS